MVQKKTFSNLDQVAFAQISGDWNPMHMDELAARRRMFGRCVVHGIHLGLWALDQLFNEVNHGRQACLLRWKAVFHKPVGVGEPVTLKIVEYNESDRDACVEMAISSVVGTVTTLKVSWEWLKSNKCGKDYRDTSCVGISEMDKPRSFLITELGEAKGSLLLSSLSSEVTNLFPGLSNMLPNEQLQHILATTRLVGMECPGLHSVFYAADLVFSAALPDDQPDQLAYRVTRFDPRFRRATIAVEASGCSGTLTAFVHSTQSQPEFVKLSQRIRPGEFSGQRALVVGGSRGIGEVTCKLLAAGGAEVLLTYCRGKADADVVAQQIHLGGGSVHVRMLDVLAKDLMESMPADFGPTHLYYFATPFIFAGSSTAFQQDLFQKFCHCYVSAFAVLVEGLIPSGLTHILYPSSTALDELPTDMAEYTAAKAGGEAICALLANRHSQLRVLYPRLPRVATDQTATFLPVETGDLVSVMLSHLRELSC